MPSKLDLNKTRETFDKLLAQAKESVKVLETLKEEGLAKARSFMPPMPPLPPLPKNRGEAQKLANEKIVSSLKKMGLATRSEVRDLEKKVEELQSELRKRKAKKDGSDS